MVAFFAKERLHRMSLATRMCLAPANTPNGLLGLFARPHVELETKTDPDESHLLLLAQKMMMGKCTKFNFAKCQDAPSLQVFLKRLETGLVINLGFSNIFD